MTENEKPKSWRDLLVKVMELGLGAVTLTKEAGQKVISELEEKGQMSRQEATETFEKIRDAGREQKQRLEEMVGKMVDRALERTDVARQSEVNELHERIRQLESIVANIPAVKTGDED